MLHICRLCLQGGVTLYNIVNAGLQDTFETVTRVMLDDTDGYPQDVCVICYAQLKKCKKLIEMSFKSELLLADMAKHQFSPQIEKMSGMRGALCTLVITETSVISYDSDSSGVISVKKEFDPSDTECVFSVKKECDASDTECEALEGIKLEDEPQLSIKAEYKWQSSPKTQIHTATEDYEEQETGIKQYVTQTSTKCDNSAYVINTESSGLLMSQTDANFTCIYCNKSFKLNHMLEQHIARTHMIETVTISPSNNIHTTTGAGYQESVGKLPEDNRCGDFSKMLQDETKGHNVLTHKLDHRQSNTRENPFSCSICDKTFISKGNLTRHNRIHTGEKPRKCDLCGKTFADISCLNKHMRIHTGEIPYMCYVCDKIFSCQSKLSRHKIIHTGEKPYKCNLCDKRFNDVSYLNNHMRIHTGEISYKCHVCDKRYICKSKLLTHNRIHTGEKPFKCDECEKRFTRKSSLETHIRTHTGEKPYKCDVCGKRFICKPKLDRHQIIHTGEKPYTCDVCNKRFTRKFALHKHMPTHNGEEPYK